MNSKRHRSGCPVSHVTCHMSHVTCHMSHVTCHMSHVTCHTSLASSLPTRALFDASSCIRHPAPSCVCTQRHEKLNMCLNAVFINAASVLIWSRSRFEQSLLLAVNQVRNVHELPLNGAAGVLCSPRRCGLRIQQSKRSRSSSNCFSNIQRHFF
jgi:hypothetical protein